MSQIHFLILFPFYFLPFLIFFFPSSLSPPLVPFQLSLSLFSSFSSPFLSLYTTHTSPPFPPHFQLKSKGNRVRNHPKLLAKLSSSSPLPFSLNMLHFSFFQVVVSWSEKEKKISWRRSSLVPFQSLETKVCWLGCVGLL